MSSRRRFLGTAAGATGVALGAAVWGAGTAAAAVTAPEGAARRASRMGADKRGYTAGRFALDIGGVTAGWVQSVEGGSAYSDVVQEKLGPDHVVHKHVAGVKYEDITLTIGTGMSKAVYDWMSASFNMNFQRKDGAIHSCDYDGNIIETMDFFHALISEIGFPAADASSKDSAFLTLKISPEVTRRRKGDGAKVKTPANADQKMFTPSNFRLQIDGLDCTRVAKVDAITVKQSNVTDSIGEQRDYQKEPSNLEIPNLRVQLPAAFGDTWRKWHEDFVIKGLNDQGHEKTGSLTYLTPNLQEELFTLTFQNLGIFRCTPDQQDDAPSDNVQYLTSELYSEQMRFAHNLDAGKPPKPTPTPAPNKGGGGGG